MPWRISFALSLWAWIILDRLTACLSRLFLALARPGLLNDSQLQTYAGIQFAGSFVSIATQLAVSAFALAGSVLRFLLGNAVWLCASLVLFTTLHVLFEYQQESLIEMVTFWNKFLGPSIHTLIISPLNVFSVFIQPLLGVYNFFVWVGTQVFYQVTFTSSCRALTFTSIILLGFTPLT